MSPSIKTIFLFFFVLVLAACQEIQEEALPKNKGSLFIIGGGSRPPEMVSAMLELAGLDSSDYILILPMASSVPDTAAWYAARQFRNAGHRRIGSLNFDSSSIDRRSWLDSVAHAGLIYLTGGSQERFMEVAAGSSLPEIIRKACKNGAMIAGTSAGAALMSRMMITGDEFKHPEYTGYFRTIEAGNMEIIEGLGLLEEVIVDQHFIVRMRMNRLMTVVAERPGSIGLGIDESTAVYVHNEHGVVYGLGQVVVLENEDSEPYVRDSLLGVQDLRLDIYLPGDTLVQTLR